MPGCRAGPSELVGLPSDRQSVSFTETQHWGGPGVRRPWALLFTEFWGFPDMVGPQSGSSVLRQQDFCCNHRGKGSLNSIQESLGVSGCRAGKPKGQVMAYGHLSLEGLVVHKQGLGLWLTLLLSIIDEQYVLKV